MGTSLSIGALIDKHKDLILAEIRVRLTHLPGSPYQKFLLETEAGQDRLATWVDLIAKALYGDTNLFLEDQAGAGYQRAIQGFQMEDVSLGYQTFLESCLRVAMNVVPSGSVDGATVIKECERLSKLCLKGHAEVAAAFLRTREEIITEKVAILQKLLDFTRRIVTTFDVEAILRLVAAQLSSVFDAKTFITVRHAGRLYRTHDDDSEDNDPELTAAMDKSWDDATPVFVGEEGKISTNVDGFEAKRVVSVPIGAHGRIHGALGLLTKNGGVAFTRRELDLLVQYIYIVAMALENAFMVDEIERSRGELSLLASKLITVKEEQRRQLAADIHDTVAQALAGIGYKIQFCSEVARNKPDLAVIELEGLLKAVDQAIRQCRALISNLRPDLIDTIGLIPALRRLFENYSADTGIEVLAELPENMELTGNVNICVYRVAQEALRNVQRHSEADAVLIRLTDEDGLAVLKVEDDGKGFDISEQPPWVKDPNKVGLLYMRQRVEAVGGTVSVQTGPDQGCRLTVMIPSRSKEDILEKNKGHDR